MVNPPVMEATFATGIILIASGFYGTQFLINHRGSDTARLALETNSECLSLGVKSDYYANCTYKLERLMKNLTESGEIRVDDCELDEKDDTIAYCPVWVWYYPQWLPMTDVTIVGVVGTKTSTGLVKPSSKLEQILTTLSEASRKTPDLTEEESVEHLNKLEEILASKPLGDLSDKDKKDLHLDELDKIFSTMLDASEDNHLSDALATQTPDSLNSYENVFSVLSSASKHLADVPGGKVTQELDNVVSKLSAPLFERVDSHKPGLSEIENSLQGLTKHISLNDFESALTNINTDDFEHFLTSSNILETLMQDLNTKNLEEPIGKVLLLNFVLPSLRSNGDTVDKFAYMTAFLHGLDKNDIKDLLDKSGFIEIIVQHLEAQYLDDVDSKSEIEKALVQNLKTNHYFEDTLKSVIAEAIADNLKSSENTADFGKFQLLQTLAPSLAGGPLEKLALIKGFLQNLNPEDIDNLIAKSGILDSLPTHFETNYIETFHDKSDLGQALVDNLKANQYLDESVKLSLMKQITHIPEGSDKNFPVESSHVSYTANVAKDELNPLNNYISLYKLLSPSLDLNMLKNPKNIELMTLLLKNIKTEDVKDFINKSGIFESLMHSVKNFPTEPEEKSVIENEYISSDGLKSLFNDSLNKLSHSNGLSEYVPTKDLTNSLNTLDFLKLLAPSLDSNVFENPINKMFLASSLLQHLDMKDVEHFFNQQGLVEALLNFQTKYPTELPGKTAVAQTVLQNIKPNEFLDKTQQSGILNQLLPSEHDSQVAQDIVKAVAKTVESNNLKYLNLPGKMDTYESQAHGSNTENILSNPFGGSFLNNLFRPPHNDEDMGLIGRIGLGQSMEGNLEKDSDKEYNVSDLVNLFIKNQHLISF